MRALFGLILLVLVTGCKPSGTETTHADGPLQRFAHAFGQGMTQDYRAKEQEIELMAALTEQSRATPANPYNPSTPQYAEFELAAERNRLMAMQQLEMMRLRRSIEEGNSAQLEEIQQQLSEMEHKESFRAMQRGELP